MPERVAIITPRIRVSSRYGDARGQLIVARPVNRRTFRRVTTAGTIKTLRVNWRTCPNRPPEQNRIARFRTRTILPTNFGSPSRSYIYRCSQTRSATAGRRFRLVAIRYDSTRPPQSPEFRLRRWHGAISVHGALSKCSRNTTELNRRRRRYRLSDVFLKVPAGLWVARRNSVLLLIGYTRLRFP